MREVVAVTMIAVMMIVKEVMAVTVIAVVMIVAVMMMIAAVVSITFHYGVLITWLHSILQVL